MKTWRIAGTFFLVSVSGMSLAEPVVEIFPVYNRPASEIEPLLAPLLESTDQIVANGDTMIVKTTPDRVQTLGNLIRKLDSPLNSLQITVIQRRNVTASQLNAGAGLSFNLPTTGAPGTYAQAKGYYAQSEERGNHQDLQTVRTLDGVPAQIQIGHIVPIGTYQNGMDSYGYPYESRSTQFIEATTGIEVTPRLVGQQVILDVTPWSDRFNSQGQIQTQRANTSVRANLGEWVEIGGVDENRAGSGNGVLSLNRYEGQNSLRIFVKVDAVK